MIIAKILNTAEELACLRPSWAALLEDNPAADRPFLAWEWFEASLNAFARDASRYVVVLQEHGRTIGILPLVRQQTRQYGMTIYELTFCPNFNTPNNNVLVSSSQYEREAVRAALDAILADRRSWHILRLENVPRDSELSKLLAETEKGGIGMVIRSEGWQSPCVRFRDYNSFDHYLMAIVKAHYRNKLRRDLKRLKETGQEWRVDYFETPENIAGGLEELFQIRRASWKGSPADAFVRFFQEISPYLACRREVLIIILRVGGRAVAAQYLVCKDGEFYMILNDHDQQYHDALAPGKNLMTLVLQEGFNRKWSVFDFSGDDDEYKRRMATSTRSHCSFQVFNSRLKSRTAYVGKTRVLPLMRKVLGKKRITVMDEE